MNAPQPPQSLVDLQRWFYQAIGESSDLTEAENVIASHLTASKNLTPTERLAIYVDDYWPRYFDCLAEDFPKLVRRLGRTKFDEWMEKYVLAYPCMTHSLFPLGENLYSFMSENYRESDRDAVLELIAYEWALAAAYFRPQEPAFDPTQLTPDQQSALATLPLTLQPHVSLLDHKQKLMVVYRLDDQVKIRPIHRLFYTLLQQIQSGLSLESALDSVMGNLSEKESHILAKNSQKWFQTAVRLGWFTHPVSLLAATPPQEGKNKLT